MAPSKTTWRTHNILLLLLIPFLLLLLLFVLSSKKFFSSFSNEFCGKTVFIFKKKKKFFHFSYFLKTQFIWIDWSRNGTTCTWLCSIFAMKIAKKKLTVKLKNIHNCHRISSEFTKEKKCSLLKQRLLVIIIVAYL